MAGVSTVLVILYGCAAPITLEPSAERLPSLGRLPHKIGIYYSPEFRTQRQTAGGSEFQIGSASAELLRRVFKKTFDEVTELSARTASQKAKKKITAIIEPSIEAFQSYSMSVGEPRHWAQITYRFKLYTPDGKFLTTWAVNGEGESYGAPGRAETLAMELAAGEFVTSFKYIPEAKRWAEGLPVENATVLVRGDQNQPPVRFRRHDLRRTDNDLIEFTATPDTPQTGLIDSIRDSIRASGLFAVKISLKNKRGNRLRLRRSDIALVTADGGEILSLPPTAVYASITTPGGRIHPVGHGIGPTQAVAIVNLFSALGNFMAAEAEKERLASISKAYRGLEFKDAILMGGSSTGGIVYFALPTIMADKTLELSAPVVDIDSATRYKIEVPIDIPPVPKK
jgi:hypothetical protein